METICSSYEIQKKFNSRIQEIKRNSNERKTTNNIKKR
jgi:hypothetical protein